jgi:hypothetical protein
VATGAIKPLDRDKAHYVAFAGKNGVRSVGQPGCMKAMPKSFGRERQSVRSRACSSCRTRSRRFWIDSIQSHEQWSISIA